MDYDSIGIQKNEKIKKWIDKKSELKQKQN